MKVARWLLLSLVFAMVGNVGARSDDTKDVVLKPGTSICIPCTHWCKTHPNDPRCN